MVMVCVMAMISTFGVVANSTALVTLLLGFVKRKTFTKPFALFLMLSLTGRKGREGKKGREGRKGFLLSGQKL